MVHRPMAMADGDRCSLPEGFGQVFLGVLDRLNERITQR